MLRDLFLPFSSGLEPFHVRGNVLHARFLAVLCALGAGKLEVKETREEGTRAGCCLFSIHSHVAEEQERDKKGESSNCTSFGT